MRNGDVRWRSLAAEMLNYEMYLLKRIWAVGLVGDHDPKYIEPRAIAPQAPNVSVDRVYVQGRLKALLLLEC